MGNLQDYIGTLPAVDRAEAFGQHPNADIAYQIEDSWLVLESLLSLQPQTVLAAGGRSREDTVGAICADLLDQVHLYARLYVLFHKLVARWNSMADSEQQCACVPMTLLHPDICLMFWTGRPMHDMQLRKHYWAIHCLQKVAVAVGTRWKHTMHDHQQPSSAVLPSHLAAHRGHALCSDQWQLPQVPAPFDLEAVMKDTASDPSALHVVLLQEVERYNSLLVRLRSSCSQVQAGLKGLVVMSADLDEIADALYNAKVQPNHTCCLDILVTAVSMHRVQT